MRRHIFNINCRLGLTLVEALVATVILTVGLAGIVSAMLNALNVEGEVLGYLFAVDVLASQKTELLLDRFARSGQDEEQDLETSAGLYHYQRSIVSEELSVLGDALVPVNIQVGWGSSVKKNLEAVMIMIAEPVEETP